MASAMFDFHIGDVKTITLAAETAVDPAPGM